MSFSPRIRCTEPFRFAVFSAVCVSLGPNSIDRPISVNRNSELIGRSDDSGVPFQGLRLSLVADPFD